MSETMPGLDKLETHSDTYQKLARQWQHAKSCIVASIDYASLHEYRILHKGGGDNELRFSFFGAVVYVAFGHDLENGWLEYGAVQPLPAGERHVPVHRLDFSPEGDVTEGCNLSDYASYEPLHVRILAEHAQALVRAYFGRGE